jgi:GNAT superfamily N-acetyltransferase
MRGRGGRDASATLVPLSPGELETFVELQVAEFADEKRRAGHWTAEEAVGQSRKAIRGLLGEDPGARGHRFFKGVAAGGERVGWMWIGPVPEGLGPERAARWLYQITIEESVRGQGFGRGMLTALERLLAREGVETSS